MIFVASSVAFCSRLSQKKDLLDAVDKKQAVMKLKPLNYLFQLTLRNKDITIYLRKKLVMSS